MVPNLEPIPILIPLGPLHFRMFSSSKSINIVKMKKEQKQLMHNPFNRSIETVANLKKLYANPRLMNPKLAYLFDLYENQTPDCFLKFFSHG